MEDGESGRNTRNVVPVVVVEYVIAIDPVINQSQVTEENPVSCLMEVVGEVELMSRWNNAICDLVITLLKKMLSFILFA